MKKILLVTKLVLLVSFGLSFNKANAAGCRASCFFSSCIIVNCSGPAACGCYYGLAICKCDSGSSGDANRRFNAPNINDFNDYAYTNNSVALISLTYILESITEDNYDEKFNEYKNAVEALNNADMNLLKNYLGIE